MSDDHVIHLEGLPQEVIEGTQDPADEGTAGDELAAIEKAHLVEVLRREGGNKVRAAQVLGIHRRSLYRLLDKYGLR